MRLCGAEAGFFNIHAARFRPPLQEASEFCGIDLVKGLLSDTVGDLPDEKQQFFTYAFSVGAAKVAFDCAQPIVSAGYSFGIYAALTAAEAISFHDGLVLVDRAARLMQAASAGKGCGMGITVGLDVDDIAALLREGSFKTLLRTNTNHPACHVFSGLAKEVDRFLRAAAAAGAFKSERLTVDIPYHHPELLAGFPGTFAAGFDDLTWRPARIPVVSSITGALLRTPEELRLFTAAHPATPICWERVLATLDSEKIPILYECGPGISLTQNGRFVDFDAVYINIKKSAKWGER